VQVGNAESSVLRRFGWFFRLAWEIPESPTNLINDCRILRDRKTDARHVVEAT
jgi:hypothetical protein